MIICGLKSTFDKFIMYVIMSLTHFQEFYIVYVRVSMCYLRQFYVIHNFDFLKVKQIFNYFPHFLEILSF